ncbi:MULTISPECIES: hypothetical protein [unclassified Burkholderia]|uniref:hypothetical protein n=1 Tax=unclassified Burkholderia TaxID=2613784 RepID=UPI002AB24C1A|nr:MULTISPECIES: hypothetical protein [unclassified Burkholderia]
MPITFNRNFLVADDLGRRRLPAEQLATFTYTIDDVRYRFVVTRLARQAPAVTHRESGKSLAGIAPRTVNAALGDYVVAGRSVVARIVKEKGAARLREVLDAALAASAAPVRSATVAPASIC